MAVTQSGNVWTLTAASDSITGTIFIHKILWYGMSASDTLSLVDNSTSAYIIMSSAGGSTDPQEYEIDKKFDGLTVSAIGSGGATLLVFGIQDSYELGVKTPVAIDYTT